MVMKNKNIFLISTDKESLLHKSHDILITSTELTGKNDLYNSTPQFIYITNNELPKLDEWGINLANGVLFKDKGFTPDEYSKANSRKVVVTNDTSLIEDGVQQVSSSFLSFFAENQPDYVEVESNTFDTGDDTYFLIFPQKSKLEITKVSQLNEDGTETDITDKPELWHINKSPDKTMLDNLKDYFKNTLREKVLSDWEETKKNSPKGLKTEEKLYTKEEVIEAIKKYNNDNNTLFFDTDKKDVLNNWIENNL